MCDPSELNRNLSSHFLFQYLAHLQMPVPCTLEFISVKRKWDFADFRKKKYESIAYHIVSNWIASGLVYLTNRDNTQVLLSAALHSRDDSHFSH